LRADRTAPIESRQGELFTGLSASVAQERGELLERLANRLGVDRVLRPVRTADALPERAVRYVPLIGEKKASGPFFAAKRDPGAFLAVSERPLRLITPPLRIDVATVMPDCSPAAIQWRGWRHLVARRWGPERIETGWWRHGTVRRDYFRVETDAGCRLWVFRDLSDDTWYLHGSFE
jgi:protein ImuB